MLVSDSHTADGGNHRVQLFTPGRRLPGALRKLWHRPRQFGGAAPIRQYGFDHGPGIGPGPIGPAGIAVNTQADTLRKEHPSRRLRQRSSDRLPGAVRPSRPYRAGETFARARWRSRQWANLRIRSHMHEPPMAVQNLIGPASGGWSRSPLGMGLLGRRVASGQDRTYRDP